jgi:short-subunit dehydrogenase
MPDHRVLEQSPANVAAVLRINLSVPTQIIMHAANHLEHQGSGCLAVLSSVAGDVGRRSNYVYGASKAGLSAVMEGLDGRFFGTEIRALDIRPGPVKTPMTSHLQQGLFFADPDPVGRRIVKAIQAGRRGRLYVPAYWRCIMSIMRHLPSFIRRRLKF